MQQQTGILNEILILYCARKETKSHCGKMWQVHKAAHAYGRVSVETGVSLVAHICKHVSMN
jgi:hypothetical protein